MAKVLIKLREKRFLRPSIIVLCLLITSAIIYFVVVAIISYQNSIDPRGIVIHHSAVPFQITKPEDIELISEIHRQRGFSIHYWGRIYYAGYHYFILPDGIVVNGRPEKCKGAHAIGHNDYIGICLIGDFSQKENTIQQSPTKEQMESLKVLINKLRSNYKFSIENIVMHKTLDPKTECPGENFSMGYFLEYLQH